MPHDTHERSLANAIRKTDGPHGRRDSRLQLVAGAMLFGRSHKSCKFKKIKTTPPCQPLGYLVSRTSIGWPERQSFTLNLAPNRYL